MKKNGWVRMACSGFVVAGCSPLLSRHRRWRSNDPAFHWTSAGLDNRPTTRARKRSRPFSSSSSHRRSAASAHRRPTQSTIAQSTCADGYQAAAGATARDRMFRCVRKGSPVISSWRCFSAPIPSPGRQVAGPESPTLNASVFYQRDPKRRLEVLWNNESARNDTQLIVINGQSTWTAPNGLKLGMPIAAVEKINKKPFNLRAFGGENGGYVTSWDGGALATLPGGCKISIRFAPDPKAKSTSEAPLEGDKEYPSGHPA